MLEVALVEVQPYYVGCAVRGGPDPCPQRFGHLERAAHTVAVPEIEGIKMRQERRERDRSWTRYAGQSITIHAVAGATGTWHAASRNA